MIFCLFKIDFGGDVQCSALCFFFLSFWVLIPFFIVGYFFYPLGVWDSFLLCHSPLFVFLLSIYILYAIVLYVGYFLAFVHERNKIKVQEANPYRCDKLLTLGIVHLRVFTKNITRSKLAILVAISILKTPCNCECASNDLTPIKIRPRK